MQLNQLKRREFLTLLGGAGVALGSMTRPNFAEEATRTYRLGVVSGAGHDAEIFKAFFDELHQFGVTEGQNITVLPGGFGLRGEQFETAVATIVKAEPDAIVVSGDPAARLVQQATGAIPIVATSDDMFGAGLGDRSLAPEAISPASVFSRQN